MTLMRATILTGFLGSGKTTLLKRILSERHGEKIAVIENEFGEEGIDNEILVTDANETIVQMSNGCVCCTIREDLRTTLLDLARRKRAGEIDFERVVIETTGMADPGPVAQTFFLDDEVIEQYSLDAIVTLVDAKHAQQQLDKRREAQRQVGFADWLIISKGDLVTAPEQAALLERLRLMNPRAVIRSGVFGDVPIKALLDIRGFNLNDRLELENSGPDEHANHSHCTDHAHCNHPGHTHGHGRHEDVGSFVYRTRRPFDAARLQAFLDTFVRDYGPNMYRYKGILNIHASDRKTIFQGVHQLMNSTPGARWDADEDRLSKMVFIGCELPRTLLEQGLESALV